MDQPWFLLGIVVVFFALTVIPQVLQRRKRDQVLSSLHRGVWVVTAGGITGQIAYIDPLYVRLRVSKDVEITVHRQAIRTTIARPQPFDEGSDEDISEEA